VDEGGVALAAIQGLNRKVEDRSEETGARMQKAEARIQNTEVSVRHSEARMRETEASLLEKEERIRQLERLNGDLLRRLEAMEGRIDELNSRSLAGMNAIK
jgi:chromosome segregation ATPase